MIYVAPTAVSRDGQNAVFMKYIPVPLYKQFRYKIIPEIIMKGIMACVVFIIARMLFPVSVEVLVITFLLHILLSSIQSYLNLLIDLRKPKLEWDTEYAVVKQNMNLMWPMLFGMLGIGIIVLLGVLLKWVPLPYFVTMIILALLFYVCLWMIDQYVRKNENKLFEKIY